MTARNAVAAERLASLASGDTVIPKAMTSSIYRNTVTISRLCRLEASELAAAIVAHRYRLTPPVSRLVCHLAGLGGAS